MELTITFPGGKRVDAQAGEFTVRTDQPVRGGGEGSAPSPFDYFLASMGTCAGIYVLSFLQAREIPTEGVRIRQRQEFDPVTKRLAKVELSIELPPEVPAKYHAALVRAAAQCAVKRALADPPEVAVVASPID